MSALRQPDSSHANARSQADVRRLDEAERLLTCFQKGVGHELPNHLVALRGMLQMLEMEEGARLGAEGREYLHRALGAAERAHGLISGLAELGRMFRDRKLAEHVAVREVAEEATATIKKLFPEAIFDYHESKPAPVVYAPRLALCQVLIHLLRNAAQAAVADRPLRIDVAARASSAGVKIQGTDNGRGLSPDR